MSIPGKGRVFEQLADLFENYNTVYTNYTKYITSYYN